MEQSRSNSHWILVIFFLTLAGAGTAACVYLLTIPPDAKNAFILGFSIERLLLLLFIALPSGWSLYTSIRALVQPKWAVNQLEPIVTKIAEARWFFIIGVLFFVLGWIALFLPPYWFGIRRAYYIRLRPDLVWLGFCGGLSVVVLGIWKRGWRPKRFVDRLRSERGLLRAFLFALGIMLVFWLIAATTGLGITPDPLFWNEAGVPLLGIQLIFSLLIVIVFRKLIFRNPSIVNKVWIDWALVGCIWVAAFLLWQFTPMPRSYNAPGPYPPNYIYYPYSDAESYDTGAQYLLMGHGIANGDLADKPVYTLIIALLHLIAGQNYALLITLQVALMAFVPVGLYLLGKTIHGREAGVLTALFAIFQQRNAIAATVDIQVATSKLLLSEYPGALALIFTTLILVRWFQAPKSRVQLAMVGGGLLGAAALIRPNALFLAPVLVVAILILTKLPFKRRILASGLFTLTFLAAFVPWNLIIPRGLEDPYLVFKAKALFESRFQIQPQSNNGVGSSPLEIAENNGGSYKLALANPVSIPLASTERQDTSVSLSFIPEHFFHNELMAFLILPHTIELNNLEHTLQTTYWQDISAWNGQLSTGSIFLIAFNLILVALGIGMAWTRWRLAGLIPLVIHLGYYLANAIVRNSGSRYLVPVDWVLLLYFALGIIQVIRSVGCIANAGADSDFDQPAKPQPETTSSGVSRFGWQRSALIGVIFLVFGSAVPLNRFLFRDQLPVENQTQILNELKNLNWKDSSVQPWLEQIAAGPTENLAETVIIYGRGLYPRYYGESKFEPGGDLVKDRLPPYNGSHFTLRVLAPDYLYWAILPMELSPAEFEDGAMVAVIGCKYNSLRYIDAAAIVVMKDPPIIYWRSPAIELPCSLPLP